MITCPGVPDLRPRFPLFGGWKTHYLVGYNVPSYEYLFYKGKYRTFSPGSGVGGGGGSWVAEIHPCHFPEPVDNVVLST